MARPDGTGFDRPRIDGMQLGRCATNRLYETRDGWLCLVIPGEPQWQRFAAAMGITDARFASAAARATHDAALAQLLEPKFKQKTAAEWFAQLDQAGVPCEVSDPKFSLGVHEDPEFKRRGWVAEYPHPFVGKLNQIGLLFDLSDTPGRVQGPPLIVGQHSREILAELGYTPAQIEEMCKDCVLAWEPHGRSSQGPQPLATAGPRRRGGEEVMSNDPHIPPAPIRPDPVFTPDAIFFWEGAARGELLGQRCADCKKLTHPPRPMCRPATASSARL